MGRNTYEKVLSFNAWPYAKPVFVLSNTLTRLPDASAGKTEIMKGDPRQIVAELKSLGFRNLYIDGGITVQKFLSANLIDEMKITTVPVLLGGGIPLFGKLANSIRFTHLKTTVINNSMVMSYYAIKREKT